MSRWAKSKRHYSRINLSFVSVFGFILLCFYSILILFVIGWALFSSVKDDFDFMYSPFGWPESWHFDNYLTALNKFSVPVDSHGGSRDVFLFEMLGNSFLYAFGAATVNTLTCAMVGYASAKYPHKKLSHLIYAIVIFTLIFPAVGTLASEIQVSKALHTYGNYFGILFMKCNFLGMNFLIFYAAFKTIPWDYAEAAFVDGASHFRVMSRIMMPMIRPISLSAWLLSFIGYWNDYYTPMIYWPSHPTAAYGLYLYQFSSGSDISSTPMKLAGAIIVFLPVFVLFLVTKKRLIGNLTVGGLKG